MKRSKLRHPIAVDSETGLYWYGQRVLRHQVLIEEATRKSTHQERPAQHFPRVKPVRIAGKALPLAIEATGSHPAQR